MANSLQVACAIIEKEGKVLSTQRSALMSLPLKWEFPGGKINVGETPVECLRRELREELGIEVAIGQPLFPTTHHYPAFTVTLHPFICAIVEGALMLHEHAAAIWLKPEELDTLDWADADWPVLEDYQKRITGRIAGRDAGHFTPLSE